MNKPVHVIVAAATFALLVASCGGGKALVNPVVAEVEDWQKLAAAGRYDAIAADNITSACASDPAREGCGRLAALHGEANLRVALAGRAPGAVCPAGGSDAAALTGRLDTAAADLGRARASADPRLDTAARSTLAALRAHALYCLAETAASFDAADRNARAAETEAATAPAPDNALWQGRAALLLAGTGHGDDATRCAATRRAEAAARAGQAAPGAYADQFARLVVDARTQRRLIAACGS